MKRSLKYLMSALTALVLPALGWAEEVTWTATPVSLMRLGTAEATSQPAGWVGVFKDGVGSGESIELENGLKLTATFTKGKMWVGNANSGKSFAAKGAFTDLEGTSHETVFAEMRKTLGVVGNVTLDSSIYSKALQCGGGGVALTLKIDLPGTYDANASYTLYTIQSWTTGVKPSVKVTGYNSDYTPSISYVINDNAEYSSHATVDNVVKGDNNNDLLLVRITNLYPETDNSITLYCDGNVGKGGFNCLAISKKVPAVCKANDKAYPTIQAAIDDSVATLTDSKVINIYVTSAVTESVKLPEGWSLTILGPTFGAALPEGTSITVNDIYGTPLPPDAYGFYTAPVYAVEATTATSTTGHTTLAEAAAVEGVTGITLLKDVEVTGGTQEAPLTIDAPISGAYDITIASGYVTLKGVNKYGATTIKNGATLSVNGGSVDTVVLPEGKQVTVEEGGTIDLVQGRSFTNINGAGLVQVSGTYTYGISGSTSVLSGLDAAQVEVTSTGVLQFRSFKTYALSVDSLIVDGTVTNENRNDTTKITLTVAEGKTLAGTGTISVPVTLEDGAIIDATAGEVTVTGDVTLPSTGTLHVKISTAPAEDGSVLILKKTELTVSELNAVGTLSLTIGTAEPVTTGYKVITTADGYAVAVVKNYVCSVGETSYESIQGAVNANVDSGTIAITVTAATAETVKLPAGVTSITLTDENDYFTGTVTDKYGTELSGSGTYIVPTYTVEVTTDAGMKGYTALTATAVEGATAITLLADIEVAGGETAEAPLTIAAPISGAYGITIASGYVTLTGKNKDYKSTIAVKANATLALAGTSIVSGDNADNVILGQGSTVATETGATVELISGGGYVNFTGDGLLKGLGASDSAYVIGLGGAGTISGMDVEVESGKYLFLRIWGTDNALKPVEFGKLTVNGTLDRAGGNDNNNKEAIVVQESLSGYGTIGTTTNNRKVKLTLKAGSTIDASAGAVTVNGNVTVTGDGTVSVTLPAEPAADDAVITCTNAAEILSKLTIENADFVLEADGTTIKLAAAAAPVTYVAEVNGTEYETLQAAYDNAAEGDTITLLGDTTAPGIKIKKSITLDLNDKTLTLTPPAVGSTGTETLGMQILKTTESITIKDGTIDVCASNLTAEKPIKMLIQNYSKALTLSNVTLDGTNLVKPISSPIYVLSNNQGDVTIGAGTEIIAPKDAIAFDSCKYGNYEAPTVTVKAGAVIGGTVEVSGGTLDTDVDLDNVIVSSGTISGDGAVTIDTKNSTYLAVVDGFYCDKAVDAKGNDASAAAEVFTGIATGRDGSTATLAWQFGISEIVRNPDDMNQVIITAKVTRGDGETAAGYATNVAVALEGILPSATTIDAEAGIATFTVNISALVNADGTVKPIKVKASHSETSGSTDPDSN